MSTPANAATPGSDNGQAGASGDLSFEERVNQALDSAALDDKGNIILPEDLPEDLIFSARAEKRRRDTQSALAKASSSVSILSVENEELKKMIQQGKRIELSPDEIEELDELKHSDPDAWREKMNALEQTADTTITSKLTEISDKAKTKGAIGERQVLLEAFLHDNPGLVINDEVINNDIPPRITRALENGEISFMEFLGKVKQYLGTEKVVDAGSIPGSGPNLSDIGGSDIPGKKAEGKQTETEYEKMIF